MLSFLLALGTVVAGAGEPRLGWHGEHMPDGLEKTETEGEYLWKQDGSIMVYIPSGKFIMGSNDGHPDEKPVHEVWLDGYYIDKYEVSWKQWKLSGLPFTENVESRLPRVRAPDWGIVDDHPVLNVTWDDTQLYVSWAGKRLPTEAEWEKAARGTDGRKYPWGNEEPTFERALWKDHPTAKTQTGTIDACPAGVSPYGVFNMSGNVYEWVQDTYDSKYYARSPERNPVNLDEGRFRVLRGGAFVLDIEDLRLPLRYRLLPTFDRAPYIGFRAALSPKTPDPGSP